MKHLEDPTAEEVVRLGYWKTLWKYYNYWQIVKRIKFAEFKGAVITVATVVPLATLIIILPFTESYRLVRDSRRIVERDKLAKAIIQLVLYKRCKQVESARDMAGFLPFMWPSWLFWEGYLK
jgi:hypothetical protein